MPHPFEPTYELRVSKLKQALASREIEFLDHLLSKKQLIEDLKMLDKKSLKSFAAQLTTYALTRQNKDIVRFLAENQLIEIYQSPSFSGPPIIFFQEMINAGEITIKSFSNDRFSCDSKSEQFVGLFLRLSRTFWQDLEDLDPKLGKKTARADIFEGVFKNLERYEGEHIANLLSKYKLKTGRENKAQPVSKEKDYSSDSKKTPQQENQTDEPQTASEAIQLSLKENIPISYEYMEDLIQDINSVKKLFDKGLVNLNELADFLCRFPKFDSGKFKKMNDYLLQQNLSTRIEKAAKAGNLYLLKKLYKDNQKQFLEIFRDPEKDFKSILNKAVNEVLKSGSIEQVKGKMDIKSLLKDQIKTDDDLKELLKKPNLFKQTIEYICENFLSYIGIKSTYQITAANISEAFSQGMPDNKSEKSKQR